MMSNEDYLLCKEIADQALKLKTEEIESHIKDHVKSFIGDLDMSNYDVRNKVFLFLQHISTIFLNYCLNSNMYFLSDAEVEKALIGRKVIVSIIVDIRKDIDQSYQPIEWHKTPTHKEKIRFVVPVGHKKRWWEFWKKDENTALLQELINQYKTK